MKKYYLVLFGFLLSMNVFGQWATYTPVPNPPITMPKTDNYYVPRIPSTPAVPATPRLINSSLEDVAGFNFTIDKEVVLKLKILEYSNNATEIYIVGEKVDNKWISHKDLKVTSISNLLSACETDEEKEFVLWLSEHFEAVGIDGKSDRFLAF